MKVILFFFIAVVLLCIDEILVQIRGPIWINIASFGIRMVFIFFMCKTEDAKLKNDDIVKISESVAEVLKK